jgi:prenyltransferase beta subunit
MFERGILNLRKRLGSGIDKTRILALTILVLLALFNSLSPFTSFGSNHRLDYPYTSPNREQDDRAYLAESYMTTRRKAIVDYVRALQASEGYFHGYLEAPPPFDLDGTQATCSPVLDAYRILNYTDCVDELDWSPTKEFLLSLVNNGLLNLSKGDEPADVTCWTALTLFPGLGIDSAIDVEATTEFVASLQTGNGGFRTMPWITTPTLVDAYFSLDTLRIAGRLDLINLAAARSFVVGCYKDDGGFSNTLGGESDFNYAPAGIYLMEILGLQDVLNLNKTTDYLLQFWDNESGCDVQGDLLFTYRIAWSFWLLNREDSIDTTKLLQWILSLQRHAHGEFVGYPEADLDNERLVSVFYVTHILAMYNSTDLLDSEFLVEEMPVWTIPQWWIDYINSEWGTISDRNGEFHLWFLNPLFAVFVGISLGIATPLVCMYVIFKKSDERSSARAEANGIVHNSFNRSNKDCEPQAWAGRTARL